MIAGTPSTATQAMTEVPLTTWQTIRWWELKRIVFNLALMVVGVVSCFVSLGVLMTVPSIRDADVGSPFLAVFGVALYGIAANVFYTLGWIVELIVRRFDPIVARQSAKVMFKVGLIGSSVLTTAPIWLALAVLLITTFSHGR